MASEGFLTSVYTSGDVTRPTFFELVAQEQLLGLLRPAIRHVVHFVASQASPRWLPLLHRWEVISVALFAALEGYHLRVHSASCAEHFFGLRRQVATATRRLTPLEAVEAERRRLESPGLSLRHQVLSLLAVLLIPWVRWHLEDRLKEEDVQQQRAAGARGSSRLLLLYSPVHTAAHLTAVVYKVLYLVGQVDTWSPLLHLFGLRLVRHFGLPQEEAPTLSPSQKLWKWAGTAGSFTLWGALYSLQFLQWWYQREHLLQPFKPRKVPPPPPLRSPYEEPAGAWVQPRSGRRQLVLLPQDPSVCPLCHRPRRNPATSNGGYVFCYTCLVLHLQNFGHCPVTGVPMNVEEVRRIRVEEAGEGS